eukprot:14700852-Alexandrium_andersonii.AAC.1
MEPVRERLLRLVAGPTCMRSRVVVGGPTRAKPTIEVEEAKRAGLRKGGNARARTGNGLPLH